MKREAAAQRRPSAAHRLSGSGASLTFSRLPPLTPLLFCVKTSGVANKKKACHLWNTKVSLANRNMLS